MKPAAPITPVELPPWFEQFRVLVVVPSGKNAEDFLSDYTGASMERAGVACFVRGQIHLLERLKAAGLLKLEETKRGQRRKRL